MKGFHGFVVEADILASQIQSNGNRVKNIQTRIEQHSRTSRFRAVSRYAGIAARIFRNRLSERKNGGNGQAR